MNNDKELLNSFLDSYHTIMDYLRKIAAYPNEFNIFITKHKVDDFHQAIRISIIRNVIEDLDSSGHILDNRSTLPNELILSAINGIRDDFRDNHEISYACISPDSNFQTLQNTNFKLSIAIYDNEELMEAQNYNREINRNPNRFKDKNTALMLIREKK